MKTLNTSPTLPLVLQHKTSQLCQTLDPATFGSTPAHVKMLLAGITAHTVLRNHQLIQLMVNPSIFHMDPDLFQDLYQEMSPG
jgi:hypothetical protein